LVRDRAAVTTSCHQTCDNAGKLLQMAKLVGIAQKYSEQCAVENAYRRQQLQTGLAELAQRVQALETTSSAIAARVGCIEGLHAIDEALRKEHSQNVEHLQIRQEQTQTKIIACEHKLDDAWKAHLVLEGNIRNFHAHIQQLREESSATRALLHSENNKFSLALHDTNVEWENKLSRWIDERGADMNCLSAEVHIACGIRNM
jgi:chromosome segregation ATPase